MKAVRHLALIAAVAATSACAGTTGDPGTAPPPRAANVITTAEVEATGLNNALEVVQQLRPAWLRAQRGTQTLQTVQQGDDRVMRETHVMVYVDGVRRGTADQLRGVAARSVHSIEYLSAPVATQRYGTDHPRGAIVVITRT
jgi:outer membrane cobalamin receptor